MDTVFPAYAGMFLRRIGRRRGNHRFPRIRGDVPAQASAFAGAVQFSPHTRGCSGFSQSFQQKLNVFPAYAGMFPGYIEAQAI